MYVHQQCSGIGRSSPTGIVPVQVNLLHLSNLVAKILAAPESSHIEQLVLMQIAECFVISGGVFLTI